ncbi:hypothetical protein ACFSKY_13270 [Azotobacter chroococcum]|uniref:Uncharacterized protein n=1 Tax=Azotobacter chroococcum TaxID=353 RepID=A0A4R1PTK1_9GAMM|nr:hypothetical protein [Azotobacter chroococcum]TBV98911.1 hypothetical protein E0E53_05010 [Azotobacter chroococcum]TCL29351.1 hypothetical protein EV691_11925 [Azotobacter chroococcum]
MFSNNGYIIEVDHNPAKSKLGSRPPEIRQNFSEHRKVTIQDQRSMPACNSNWRQHKASCVPLLFLALTTGFSNLGFSQELTSADTTLCASQEDIYFSCHLMGGKIVSVCASKDTTATTGYVQYRYGLPASLEMIFPKEITPPKGVFKFVNASEGSVNKDILKFKNGGYTYIVHQSYISGLSVIRNKSVIFRQGCTDDRYSFISRKARRVIDEIKKSEEDFY